MSAVKLEFEEMQEGLTELTEPLSEELTEVKAKARARRQQMKELVAWIQKAECAADVEQVEELANTVCVERESGVLSGLLYTSDAAEEEGGVDVGGGLTEKRKEEPIEVIATVE